MQLRPLAMKLDTLRELIDDAIKTEGERGELRRSLADRLPGLQRHLRLPEQDAPRALIDFLTAYVEAVPILLELASAAREDSCSRDFIEPLLQHARESFPGSEDMRGRADLNALLESAFLTLRLIEEFNDHHRRCLRQPLLPFDLTEANIIVHHILGDWRAAPLEDQVGTTVGLVLLRHSAGNTCHDGHGTVTSRVEELPLAREASRVRLRIAV
jgi:hypothetical protein